MVTWMLRIALLMATAVVLTWWAIGSDWRALLLHPPQNSDVLFWNIKQRDAGFKMLDRLPQLIKSRAISPSESYRQLPEGADLRLHTDLNTFFEQQRLSGALVLHKGEIRLERYAMGHAPEKRWTSFSVAKSVTSTLVGMAIKDGYITSLSDNVADYIQGLKGSAYDGVSVAQLLTMTSGVAWNEDYTDPNSDVARFNKHIPNDELAPIVSYMRNLKRAHPPGAKWLYSTGETNLIGVLVSEASGKNLSVYLGEKIWRVYGMEHDASWLLSRDGNEISGCCIQASLRDFARFGLFILEDGVIDGVATLPANWLSQATQKQTDIGKPGQGYGFQWWTFDDGSFTARGIFGQTLFIDPQRELVIAFNGNWPNASEAKLNAQRFDFIDEIRASIDEE